jgi:hypothetical protein
MTTFHQKLGMTSQIIQELRYFVVYNNEYENEDKFIGLSFVILIFRKMKSFSS